MTSSNHRSMDNSSSSAVYVKVMEDVINKVGKEFINKENLLNQLQGLWELKMKQACAIKQLTTRDFFPSSAGKRKWDELSSQADEEVGQGLKLTSKIARLNGPNIYNHQGLASDVANTLPEPTPPALIDQNDNLDGPLNEHDDGHDLVDDDEVNQGEEHIVLAQFDTVRHARGRWRCTLRDAIMLKNNKDVLFKKAIGGFDFI